MRCSYHRDGSRLAEGQVAIRTSFLCWPFLWLTTKNIGVVGVFWASDTNDFSKIEICQLPFDGFVLASVHV